MASEIIQLEKTLDDGSKKNQYVVTVSDAVMIGDKVLTTKVAEIEKDVSDETERATRAENSLSKTLDRIVQEKTSLDTNSASNITYDSTNNPDLAASNVQDALDNAAAKTNFDALSVKVSTFRGVVTNPDDATEAGCYNLVTSTLRGFLVVNRPGFYTSRIAQILCSSVLPIYTDSVITGNEAKECVISRHFVDNEWSNWELANQFEIDSIKQSIKNNEEKLNDLAQKTDEKIFELDEEISIKTELTLTDATKVNVVLAQSNVWQIQGDGAAFFRVSKGDNFIITANTEHGTVYALVTEIPPVVDLTPASYMDGEVRNIISASESKSFEVPEDGYLYVARRAGIMTGMFPQKIEKYSGSRLDYIDNRIDEVSKGTMISKDANISNADFSMSLILNSNNTYSICGNGAKFYKINKGDIVNVTAKSSQSAVIALVKTIPNQTEGYPADYMSGEGYKSIAAGESLSAIAPEDGYVYVQYKVWGTDKFPSSCTISVNGVQYLKSELVDTKPLNDKQYFESGYIFRSQDLTKLDEGSVTQNKIFNESADDFITTDYIELNSISLKSYFVKLPTLSASFTLIEFYNADKVAIMSIKGTGVTDVAADFNRKTLKLNAPKGCKYVRYARYKNYSQYGLFVANSTNIEDIMSGFVSYSVFAPNNNILWLGTSIPESAKYPTEAAKKCGYNCINNAHGSSSLRGFANHPTTLNYASGRRLTMKVSEIEAMFAPDVVSGDITQATLDEWKNDSYEVRVLPYINGTNATQVSMIVIDHGFNDRSSIHTQMQNVDAIDWNSTDRTTFTGAFRYLLNEITKINPFIKIVIAGYFQNTYMHTDYHADEICKMQELIAEHYGISIMKAWEHSQINGSYVDGTSDYLAAFNAKYNTSYTPYSTDENGNILSMQLYCPDMMHPHSDLSGHADMRLNAVYSKLLADLI